MSQSESDTAVAAEAVAWAGEHKRTPVVPALLAASSHTGDSLVAAAPFVALASLVALPVVVAGREALQKQAMEHTAPPA